MKLKRKIKKYAYNTPGVDVTKNYFLLDYGTGEPVNLRTLENLIKKHFNILYIRAYNSILEIQYN